MVLYTFLVFFISSLVCFQNTDAFKCYACINTVTYQVAPCPYRSSSGGVIEIECSTKCVNMYDIYPPSDTYKFCDTDSMFSNTVSYGLVNSIITKIPDANNRLVTSNVTVNGFFTIITCSNPYCNIGDMIVPTTEIPTTKPGNKANKAIHNLFSLLAALIFILIL